MLRVELESNSKAFSLDVRMILQNLSFGTFAGGAYIRCLRMDLNIIQR